MAVEALASSGWMYWITARAIDSVLGGLCQSGDEVPTSLGVLSYGMFNICFRVVDQDFLITFLEAKKEDKLKALPKPWPWGKNIASYCTSTCVFPFPSAAAWDWDMWNEVLDPPGLSCPTMGMPLCYQHPSINIYLCCFLLFLHYRQF